MTGDNYILIIHESRNGSDEAVRKGQAAVEEMIKAGFYVPFGAPQLVVIGCQLIFVQAMLNKKMARA